MINVLLLTQLYSSEKFTGISMVNYYRDLISIVRTRYPGKYRWTLAVPSSREFIEWSEDELVTSDDISLLPILAKDKSNRAKVKDGFSGQDFAWFSPEAFKYFAQPSYLLQDVVLSNFYHAQPVISMQATGNFGKQFKLTPRIALPSIVNLLTECGTDAHLPQLSSTIGKLCIVSGVLSADLTVTLNAIDKQWLFGVCREICSPSVQRNISAEVILPALDVHTIPVPERPEERVHFFHGGTFESKRHLNALVKAANSVAAKVPHAKFIISTQFEKSRVPQWAFSPATEVHALVNRARYLELLAQGDFLLCAPDYEGTGLAYMEAIVSGMTPIILDRPWIRERIPPEYPFLCKTEADFSAAMFFCAEHPEEAKSRGLAAIAHVRERYSAERYGAVWDTLLSRMTETRHSATRGLVGDHFMVALARSVLTEADRPFATGELLSEIAVASEKLDARQLATIFPFLRAAFLAAGFSETPEGWSI